MRQAAQNLELLKHSMQWTKISPKISDIALIQVINATLRKLGFESTLEKCTASSLSNSGTELTVCTVLSSACYIKEINQCFKIFHLNYIPLNILILIF